MRSRLITRFIVLPAVLAVIASACGNSNPAGGGTTSGSGKNIKVAIVFDVGGLGDQGFNDASKKGLDQAIKDGYVKQENTKYVEPDATGSNRGDLLANFADQGYNLIIAASYVFSPDVDKLAPGHTNQYFAVVDGYAADAPNVTNLTFRENEGSFLVGAAAGLKTKSNILGFLGGQQGTGLIEKFQAGWEAGAKAVNPNVKFLTQYIGSTTAAFNDQTKGEALSNKMYDQGADIVFHAAGKSGLGLFKAVATRPATDWAIGVDADQYLTASANQKPHILTSMVKRVDVAVYDTIKNLSQGKFTHGTLSVGLKEGGVDFATSNPALTQDIQAKLDDFKKKIISGEIVVPTKPEDRALLMTEERQVERTGRENAPFVVMERITKRFPGVLANEEVDLTLADSEIHALVGENGAGKSTLMRVLYGLYPPDGGRIIVRGRAVRIASPRDAIALGIGMVHQHFVLVDRFTVTENIILGAEGGPLVDRDGSQERIAELARSYGLAVDPRARVEDLSVGQEQRVEILKALYRGVDMLILDEPTAVLTPQETSELFENLRRLKGAGKTVVFISHKLDEVLEIADRITVLRRGRVVGETTPTSTSKEQLAEMMVGRPVLFRLQKPDVEIGEPVLRIEGLRVGDKLNGIDLEVRAGEILGVAGVEGNGQRELAETVMGLRAPDAGRISVHGHDVTGRNVRAVRREGVSFIPEDRQERGLVLDMTLWENSLLGRQGAAPFVGNGGILSIRRIKELAIRLIREFDVRARGINVDASTLSGGNQQKLVLAREIDEDPRLLVAAQPTRGLDVGAIEFVWRQILEQKAAGRAVLLISAELDEIYALSDRIVTIYGGTITGEFTSDTSPEELGIGMTGGRAERKVS